MCRIFFCFVFSCLLCSCTYHIEPDISCDVLLPNDSIQDIISNNCIVCHALPSINNGNLGLSDIQHIEDNIFSVLDRINRPSSDPLVMPPPSSGSLSDCSIKKIARWSEEL